MADLNAVSLVNSALAGLVGASDSGKRSDLEGSDDLFKSTSNFTNLMMERVSARQSAMDDNQDAARDYTVDRPVFDNSRDEPAAHTVAAPAKPVSRPAAKAMDRHDDARRTQEGKKTNDVKSNEPHSTTAPASIAKDAKTSDDSAKSSDTAAVNVQSATGAQASMAADSTNPSLSNEPSLKGLQTVAKTLLDADKDGKIKLPDALKTILEKIAASDGSATQILPLVQNVLSVMSNLEAKLSPDALKQAAGDMTWPADITKIFDDLQVNPGIKTDEPVNLGKIIKAIRMLAHLTKQAVAKAMDAKTAALADMPIIPVVAKPHGSVTIAPVAKSTDTVNVMAASGETDPEKDEKAAGEKAAAEAMLMAGAASVSESKIALPDMGATVAVDAKTAHPITASPLASSEKPASDGLLKTQPNFEKASAPGAPTPIASGAAAGKNGETLAHLAAPAFEEARLDASSSLNPMAAALSARTVFTAGAVSPAGQNISNVPHPATQQIVVALQKSAITKDTQLSLQLNPAELGRVDIKITIDQNGKASAQIVADRADTLALLQKDTSHLEKALQNAGLNSSAQDLHYSLRDQNGQRHGQESASKRRRNLFDTDDNAKNVTVDAPVANDGLPHRVNYHA